MAGSTDSLRETSAESVATKWPVDNKAMARRSASGAVAFASILAVMALGAANNVLRAQGPMPPCAVEDLGAFDVIEERSEVLGASTKQVLEAVRKFVQARKLCLFGHEDQGIALYQNAINTAIGFDTPAVSTTVQIKSLAVIEILPSPY